MLSKKLIKLIENIAQNGQSQTQKEAAIDLLKGLKDGPRLQIGLAERAKRQACLRCEKAGIIVRWDYTVDTKEQNWIVEMAHCGAFYPLERMHEIDSPSEMLRSYYCSDEDIDGEIGGGVINANEQLSFKRDKSVSERQNEKEMIDKNRALVERI